MKLETSNTTQLPRVSKASRQKEGSGKKRFAGYLLGRMLTQTLVSFY
jgi:hypothetical protein